MEKALKRDKFCDFKIIVGQTTIPVHRWVLDFHSEYFRAMFENDFLESKQGFCAINDITGEGVKACIDFMYGDELNIDMDNVSNVLQVSHMWQLDKATEICSEFLKKNLTLSLCIGIKRIASLYDLNEIEKDCYKLISQNLSGILFCKDIGDLNNDDVIKIIDQVDEADVEKLWEFCCTWARKQMEEESNSICVVFHSFPASHFTISQFEDFIWHNEHVLSCDNCKRQLAYAFLFNAVDKEEYQFEINTCLFVKELTKKYSVEKVIERVDNFIATHFGAIILQKKFMEIPQNDFIHYMAKIDNDLKREQFIPIVEWIRWKAERNDVFPLIFNNTDGSSKEWNIALEHCFFIKFMAQKYGCVEIETEADKFMVINFQKVPTEKKFCALNEEDIKKYLSSGEIYGLDDKIIWDALNRWITTDPSTREYLFPDLFDSLILDKISYDFLRNIVCHDKRIKQNIQCTSKLMSLLFDKVNANETKMQNQSQEVKTLQRTLKDQNTKIQNQSQEVKSLQRTLSDQNTNIQKQYQEVKGLQRALSNQNTEMQNQSQEIKKMQRTSGDQNTDVLEQYEDWGNITTYT